MLRAAAGKGMRRVEATAVVAGRDVVVTLGGGTAPHVGAVALAQARPSLNRPQATSATSSVLTLLGHKDDVVAREAAERLAVACGGTAVVAAGLHVDQASPADLRALVANARRCIADLAKALSTDAKR